MLVNNICNNCITNITWLKPLIYNELLEEKKDVSNGKTGKGNKNNFRLNAVKRTYTNIVCQWSEWYKLNNETYQIVKDSRKRSCKASESSVTLSVNQDNQPNFSREQFGNIHASLNNISALGFSNSACRIEP